MDWTTTAVSVASARLVGDIKKQQKNFFKHIFDYLTLFILLCLIVMEKMFILLLFGMSVSVIFIFKNTTAVKTIEFFIETYDKSSDKRPFLSHTTMKQGFFV